MTENPNFYAMQKRDGKFKRAVEAAYGVWPEEFVLMASTLDHNQHPNQSPTLKVEAHPPGNPTIKIDDIVNYSDLVELGPTPESWVDHLNARALKFRHKFHGRLRRNRVTAANHERYMTGNNEN